MQKNRIAAAALLLLTTLLPAAAQDLHVVTTGDVHGSYFNRPYVGNKMRPSLMSVKHYVDSLRSVAGEENVILIDAGDCLQGDNASYYYNYVA
ncbi:MAG: bifunctional metallophosphatase/5'-nucleotidase, partial [Bacteroidales bacterium]|nr:bifunctional metallophosphatase/5'-nucleotidase [Bacteroidales bacterium]